MASPFAEILPIPGLCRRLCPQARRVITPGIARDINRNDIPHSVVWGRATFRPAGTALYLPHELFRLSCRTTLVPIGARLAPPSSRAVAGQAAFPLGTGLVGRTASEHRAHHRYPDTLLVLDVRKSPPVFRGAFPTGTAGQPGATIVVTDQPAHPRANPTPSIVRYRICVHKSWRALVSMAYEIHSACAAVQKSHTAPTKSGFWATKGQGNASNNA